MTMTTTIDLTALPYWEEFGLLYSKFLRPGKKVATEVRDEERVAFFLAYLKLHKRYGDKKTPLQYLELLLQGRPEEVRKATLEEANTLLPGSTETPPSSEPGPAPKPESKKRPLKRFAESYRRTVEPTTENKKEVTS